MGNSFKHRLVVGMHFVHLVAKEFRGCFKGKFWCSVLPLFYVEAIYLPVLKSSGHIASFQAATTLGYSIRKIVAK